ncbi:MAG: HAD-IC family P-type ATPase, partial [Clostridia bacterium]|nr:HAD-IC family P-type ATPase [Clostridia bacterium]
MKEYTKNYKEVLNSLKSRASGLTSNEALQYRRKYGTNEITKPKGKSLFKRILEALSEPMLIILELSAIVTLGVNIGKALKSGNGDFYECLGIVFSILISVILTVVMEGKSQKAFETLSKVYDNILVKVKRNGNLVMLKQKEIVVGDILVLESGDKIVADGRLIKSNNLKIDESTLTGESNASSKNHEEILTEKTPLAERVNMVYSGTFVTAGSGEMVVTAVGDSAEIGVIASELNLKNAVSAPLQEKLDRLGKLIAVLGLIASVFVLILSITKLFITGNVSFDTVEEAFLNSIILIVASVPEGLPTTVAIALTLNVVKLFKSNALIKKLVAAETVGCVSVICSDKTGTLTENKMKVIGVKSYSKTLNSAKNINLNIALNTTAELDENGIGQPTEIALLNYLDSLKVYDYKKLRKEYLVVSRELFDSSKKYMSTTVNISGKLTTFYKGAPEVILEKCLITNAEKFKILEDIKFYQKEGKRVIAFATKIDNDVKFDGFSYIADTIRKDVYASVLECKNAGIKVKMLTGDNLVTAFSIAK